MRPFALAGGLAAYVLFTWILQQTGNIRATEEVFLQIVAMWSVGVIALALLPATRLKVDLETAVLIRTMWFNIGVVAMALLVPGAVRIFLLVLPLFGLMYASLYLNRSHVAVMGLFTYLFYVICSAGLASYTQADQELEFFLGLGFGFLLIGGSILIFEAQAGRIALEERNTALRETMGRLHEMALRDELTGVHNRRYILDVMARQKSLADRQQQGFTVCYCDLDYFKRVNDQFGHVTGDRALRQFAELAVGVVRNIDYVSRFGGEEFVMVLVGADERAAENVANRLRTRTKQMWVPGTNDDFVLSVSIGVTAFKSGERVEDTLNRADRALYSAKMSGRDKVIVAE